MRVCRALSACLLLPALASGALPAFDLKRAKTRTPRSGFRGEGSLSSANARLNKHLASRPGIHLKACEEFSPEEVRGVLRELFPLTSEELKEVYPSTDGRRARYSSIVEMEAHWASSAPTSDPRVRDAHCHEAVMWFVHHLTSEEQQRVGGTMVLPMLPTEEHGLPGGIERPLQDTAGKFYDEKITCQRCHVGGIDSLGVPEAKPETAIAKARRCYTNYKELFNITCAPCDGIDGEYWGDSDDNFKPAECVAVAEPTEIPEEERVLPKFPPQFTVDVVWGADRFGRTTNPVKDQLPGPVAKLYGSIHGKWFMDALPGADLWMLRHDTVYDNVHEDGIPIPFIAPSVTEIHAQTAKQRSKNNTGPMVSLIHGMPDWLPGGCNCIPDPVGVPDVSASWATGLDHMEYLGRIKLKVEKLDTTMELDHWASWFFHVYMDVDKEVAHYARAPRRLSSAYAGVAVYENWVFGDPKEQDPNVWHRDIPTSPERVGPDAGKFCMNPQKVEICANISQVTFPPEGEPATISTAGGAAHHLPFIPVAGDLHTLLGKVRAGPQAIVV